MAVNSVRIVIEFIIGLACLPIAAAYAIMTQEDTNVTAIPGLSLVITLGVLVIGLGLIYHAVMQMFGKK
jgi:hypothetical protein